MERTVLLPTSDVSRWVEAVADVVHDVEDADVTVTVLHVFDEAEVDSTIATLDGEAEGVDVDSLAKQKSGAKTAEKQLLDAGLNCWIRGIVHRDEPANAILRVADEEDAERIYMYSRRRSPAGKAVFGSTLQRVILDAEVPVVVIPSALS